MTTMDDLQRPFEPIELRYMSYEFSQFGVFFDPNDSTYWTGRDSGCSCPTPWESVTGTDHLTGPKTFVEALRELDAVVNSDDEGEDSAGARIDAGRYARDRLIEFAKANGTFPS